MNILQRTVTMLKKFVLKARTIRKKTVLTPSLRTRAGEVAYITAKQMGATVPLIDEPRLKQWQYWAIIDNAFPYGSAFKTHHLLIPKRVVSQQNLSSDEKEELIEVLAELGQEYDCQIINFSRNQSIKSHYHIHLLVYKELRDQLHF